MTLVGMASPWWRVGESLGRAALYGLLPRVMLFSLLPLLFSAVLLGVLAWWGWAPANEALRVALTEWGWSRPLLDWLDAVGWSSLRTAVVPLLISLMAIPVVLLVCLLAVGAMAAPAAARLVQARRCAALKPRGQSPWWRTLLAALGLTAVALLALLLTAPLWWWPPLAALVVPLIWGWLTYRVMLLDVLADWASPDELSRLRRTHQGPLLFMGVVSGYLGTLPAWLWAAWGMLSVVMAPLLVLVSVWLYTLVFVITSLWFAHYLLPHLQQLRQTPTPLEDLT